MKEAAFVKQNKQRWEAFEKIVKNQDSASPDQLAELFIQLTDDLSYARTKYPDSRTTNFLNALASKLHLKIYQNKREEKSRFGLFWKFEVPEAIYHSRKQLLYAFLIFIISGVLGVISSIYDDTFVRLVLSDGYVNMTLENIKNGNPTGVYGIMDEMTMFFMITWNNVLVSFRVFVVGIFTSIGTGYLLFRNGIMVGTFIMLFYQESQLSQALPVIMLHGTIELTSIVIAGAAGFTMGNSFLFPGTYSRLESFKRGGKRGMKIVVGLIPFFIIAGFLESFVTRYAFMHWSLKMLVIGLSAALMIYYFIVYPYILNRKWKISYSLTTTKPAISAGR